MTKETEHEIHFDKLSELPKGSEIFQMVMTEINRERLGSVSDTENAENQDQNSPRPRVNSKSSKKSETTWQAARHRIMTRKNLYKTVLMAVTKNKIKRS